MRKLFDSVFDRLNEQNQRKLDHFIYGKHDLDRDEVLDRSIEMFFGWAIEMLIEQKIEERGRR
jgi:hypothetical protein